MSKYMNFSNNKKQNSWSFMIVFFALFFSAIVGITLAFFFANEWASNSVKLSGKVDIMAEGPGDVSIEDTNNECKLIINLDNGYNRFIPGMPIKMPVDVKVFRSTTMPLMRANVTTSLLINEPLGEDSEENEIMQNLQDQIFDFIETHGWYLHTDGYFYYIADNTDIKGGDTILAEVDATESPENITFIAVDDVITFPTWVTTEYSGIGVQFIITFQAIQNYIPDENGRQLPNTITNSLKIFDEIASN